MRKLVLVVVLVAWFGGSVAQTDVSFADESSTIAAAPFATRAKLKADVSKIYGKIMFVDSFPDYKVQIVNSFPDYKIQIANSFPDFTVQYVKSFPGVP